MWGGENGEAGLDFIDEICDLIGNKKNKETMWAHRFGSLLVVAGSATLRIDKNFRVLHFGAFHIDWLAFIRPSNYIQLEL